MPLTLSVYLDFSISSLVLSITTELIAAINSFCISVLVCIAFRGIVLIIALKLKSFLKV